jgi:hypothetical protein
MWLVDDLHGSVWWRISLRLYIQHHTEGLTFGHPAIRILVPLSRFRRVSARPLQIVRSNNGKHSELPVSDSSFGSQAQIFCVLREPRQTWQDIMSKTFQKHTELMLAGLTTNGHSARFGIFLLCYPVPFQNLTVSIPWSPQVLPVIVAFWMVWDVWPALFFILENGFHYLTELEFSV